LSTGKDEKLMAGRHGEEGKRKEQIVYNSLEGMGIANSLADGRKIGHICFVRSFREAR
jgi:hypothetical protein